MYLYSKNAFKIYTNTVKFSLLALYLLYKILENKILTNYKVYDTIYCVFFGKFGGIYGKYKIGK